jgi:CRP-like cAMP-binding protein
LTSSVRAPVRRPNRLLAALAGAGFIDQLEPTDLTMGQVLYEAEETAEYAYFPETTIVSLATVLADGRTHHSVSVGNEGFVGIATALTGVAWVADRAVAKVAGRATRVPSGVLAAALERRRIAHRMLLRYIDALVHHISQRAACDHLHSMNERFARLLLLAHDRLGVDRFLMTQEVLAAMLGVRRATVNATARSLQRAGLIDYRRGWIAIEARRGLELASCECYGVIRRAYDRQWEPAGPAGPAGPESSGAE